MKRLSAFLGAITTLTIFVSSCSMFSGADNDGKTRIIQDSLVNVLPTWQALKIKVDDNNTNMHIVVGDATLYKASDDVKKSKADEVAHLVLRIYGKGNYLEKGTFTVTADTKNTSETPADGVNVPIDFSGLKKSMGQ
jgi:hypothetical protein